MAGLAKGMLAQSVHDAAWSLLIQYVPDTVARAGADAVLVDSRSPSQTCPAHRTIQALPRAIREYAGAGGCTLDRDVAAAMTVRDRAFGLGPGHGLQGLERTGRRVAVLRSRLQKLAAASPRNHVLILLPRSVDRISSLVATRPNN